MEHLRTPDARFANLPDFPYEPRYVEVPPGLRMAWVEAGPADGQTVLMLHGEPSWSFLYRKVMKVVADAGLRAVAPDLIGFGRSDKPTKREDYTYQSHIDWVAAFIEKTKLSNITLLCQDWGGLLGLRLVGEHPEWFSRVVAANTFLPTGDQKVSPAFFNWRDLSQNIPEFPVGRIVSGGCTKSLSEEVIAAYDAPFPDESFKAGARQFPMLVPVTPDDPAAPANRRAWEGLERFDKPFFTAFSDGDPITKGADRILQQRIPGARDRAHETIASGGHFLQEDQGEALGAAVVRFIRST
ncbi:MAG: haloalkane dehalogenase [Polyangiales bacterium]